MLKPLPKENPGKLLQTALRSETVATQGIKPGELFLSVFLKKIPFFSTHTYKTVVGEINIFYRSGSSANT